MDTSKYEILKLNHKEPLDSKLERSFKCQPHASFKKTFTGFKGY